MYAILCSMKRKASKTAGRPISAERKEKLKPLSAACLPACTSVGMELLDIYEATASSNSAKKGH